MGDAEVVSLYGRELELYPPEDGEVVVDVIVIARAVRYDENGHAQDRSLCTYTESTPGIIQLGMMKHATSTLLSDEV